MPFKTTFERAYESADSTVLDGYEEDLFTVTQDGNVYTFTADEGGDCEDTYVIDGDQEIEIESGAATVKTVDGDEVNFEFAVKCPLTEEFLLKAKE